MKIILCLDDCEAYRAIIEKAITEAGKLTSFYPYQVLFVKSENKWKRHNPTKVSTATDQPALRMD